MILIAIIIIICSLVELIMRKCDEDVEDRIGGVIIAGVLCIIFILPVALFAPLAGCEEKQCVEEIELIPLKNQEVEGTWYLYDFESSSGSDKLLYAYNNMDEYDLEGEAYEEEEIYNDSDVKIYESDECTKPIMKKYVAKGKVNAFSFAIGYKDKETVIFVPTGTVLEEVDEESE